MIILLVCAYTAYFLSWFGKFSLSNVSIMIAYVYRSLLFAISFGSKSRHSLFPTLPT